MEAIYQLIPELSELDSYAQLYSPQKYPTMKEWIWQMIQKQEIYNPDLLIHNVMEQVLTALRSDKHIFVTLVIIIFISNFIQIVMESLHNKSGMISGKYVLLCMQLIILIGLWKEMLQTGQELITQMMAVMKLAIPAFMTCVALTGQEITSVLMKRIWMSCICGMESNGLTVGYWILRIYVIFAVMDIIFQEGKFRGILVLLKRTLHLAIKGCFYILNFCNVLQLMVIPRIDHVNQTLLTKAVGGIPGIGDLSESITDVTISALSTIKGTVGVIVMLIMGLVMIPDMVRIVCMLSIIKASEVIGEMIGDSMMSKGMSHFVDAGNMLVKLILMVACLFCTSIALLVAVGG